MKISALAQGSGVPSADVSQARTSPDRLQRAKAIAAGDSQINVSASENTDPQVEKLQANIRKIKMRTNFSTDRTELPLEPQAQSTIEHTDEAQPEAEATKPLSPQFAALAKQKRALQQERAKFEEEKAAFTQTTQGSVGVDVDRLKSDPLGVLSEHGVSYDQLTEAILNGSGNPEIAELKAKIAKLEKGVEDKFSTHEQAQEQMALAEMRREADRMVAQGEDFEVTRATGSTQKAIDLIHRTYKDSGEVLDVRDALELIETQLIEDNLKFAQLSKVRSRLTPTETAQQAQQGASRGMRTLTNRDSATPPMSKRERAILAAHGLLKK